LKTLEEGKIPILKVHHVFLTKPDTFWQKQRTLLAKGKFSFEVNELFEHIVIFPSIFNGTFLHKTEMVSVDTLAKIINPNQLPSDLNGNLHYDHQMWLDMRLAAEDGLAKANDLLDSYEDVKDQMEDLVTWLDDWKWEGGGGQPEIHGVEYLKENLQRHTDIRKRIRSETVDQLQALVHTIIQKYPHSFIRENGLNLSVSFCFRVLIFYTDEIELSKTVFLLMLSYVLYTHIYIIFMQEME